jgi:uncharacterized protein HemX
MNLALVVLLALALSAYGNVWQWHRNGVEHDARTAAETEFDAQRTATETCNASIANLEQQAKDRDSENTKLRKEAENRRRAQESLAQQILATPPTVPGNDCLSAKDRVTNWLKGRKP